MSGSRQGTVWVLLLPMEQILVELKRIKVIGERESSISLITESMFSSRHPAPFFRMWSIPSLRNWLQDFDKSSFFDDWNFKCLPRSAKLSTDLCTLEKLKVTFGHFVRVLQAFLVIRHTEHEVFEEIRTFLLYFGQVFRNDFIIAAGLW